MVGIVLVPAVAGTLLKRLFPRTAEPVGGVLPLIAVVLVILIVGGAKAEIAAHAGPLLAATFLLHALNFALGWALARPAGLGVAEQRTVSIEVGMQNSGLGSGLAKTSAFAAQFADAAQAALAPVPAAISALWHVVIGSLLASWWLRRPGS